ncbi:phosphatase PAP2 family protein [Flavobacterium cerinum]|uniref:Phosphatase PAP2 family protein n=1 Tax=Flavobacterium cerinum TaxID=2502784 RepID=A0A3S3TVN7_9FLAO|nr:phosphatase PAP2 family protein [Flavobacterium cerinum]RWW92299.1 phosphatase PAP2 family protein [Flavobacterium cerinum]
MLETLQQLDRDLLVYLNSLGSETFDPIWKVITKQIYWTPVFLFIGYLAYKKLGWRHTLLIVGMIALLVAFTDQATNLIKNTVQRLRPCNNPEIADVIRAVVKRKSFSFVSGHASNSMASAFFLFMVLRRYYKYMGFIFLWPLVFAYSRIYLGLHYPGDILAGYCLGLLTGFLILKLYIYLRNRYFQGEQGV